MQPNLELARLIGSFLARRAFGNEVLEKWLNTLNGLQLWRIRCFVDYGAIVFDDKLLAKRHAENIMREFQRGMYRL